MRVVWPLLAFLLGAFAVVEFVAVIMALASLGDIGAKSAHSAAYQVAFVLVEVALMVGAAVGARACSHQSARYRKPRTPHPPRPGRGPRPWER